MAKLTKAALNRKKPVTDEVLIPTSEEQEQALLTAQQLIKDMESRLSVARIGADEVAESEALLALEKAKIGLEDAKDLVRKEGTAFTLVAIGAEPWDELLLAHPPSEAQEKEDAELAPDKRRTFNPDTFWPALLAASVPDSTGLTAADWRTSVFESKAWSAAEIETLKVRASAVNQGSRILELGN